MVTAEGIKVFISSILSFASFQVIKESRESILLYHLRESKLYFYT